MTLQYRPNPELQPYNEPLERRFSIIETKQETSARRSNGLLAGAPHRSLPNTFTRRRFAGNLKV